MVTLTTTKPSRPTKTMSASRSWRGSVYIATSLDGFIARSDGDIDWLTDPPPLDGHAERHASGHPPPEHDDFMAEVDHVVMGRGTLEKVLTFDEWPYEAYHVVVLSTSLTAGADTRFTVMPSVAAAAQLLTDRNCEVAYIDGGEVIRAFLEADLIDDLTISVAPVLLGEGLPLFDRLDTKDDIHLVLTGVSTSDTGMTSSRYLVTHA